MRTKRSVFVVGMLLFLGLFIAGGADAAPDMSKWEGQWFTYTVTLKGIQFEGGNFFKGSSKESGYFKIWDWDGENFQIDVYYLDEGVWQSEAQTLKFLAGNNMKFMILLQNVEDGFAFAALVDGKEKKGVLGSATITTYGGIVADGDDNDFEIGSISLTGKMIDASKVKVPSAVWVH